MLPRGSATSIPMAKAVTTNRCRPAAWIWNHGSIFRVGSPIHRISWPHKSLPLLRGESSGRHAPSPGAGPGHAGRSWRAAGSRQQAGRRAACRSARCWLPSSLHWAAAGGTECRRCSCRFPGNPRVCTCSGTLGAALRHRAARRDLQAGASTPGITRASCATAATAGGSAPGYTEGRCRSHGPRRYRRRREPWLPLGR